MWGVRAWLASFRQCLPYKKSPRMVAVWQLISSLFSPMFGLNISNSKSLLSDAEARGQRTVSVCYNAIGASAVGGRSSHAIVQAAIRAAQPPVARALAFIKRFIAVMFIELYTSYSCIPWRRKPRSIM